MEKLKKFFLKILFPPVWLIFLLAAISTATLIFVFLKGWETTPLAYIVYVLSFYALTSVVLFLCVTIPKHYKKIKAKLYSNQYFNRYFTDPAFKTKVNLYGSFSINFIYVAINIASGIIYNTAWFIVFAFYYMVLAIMRLLLMLYVTRNKIGDNRIAELKRSRLCAIILTVINLALTAAVLMMIYFGRGFYYQGFLIYVAAAYTFYVTTLAIINIFKYKKYNSPVMSTARVISLATSLFSMLFLETAMFAQFGSDFSLQLQQIMIMATGGVIAAMVVIMASCIIIRTTKEIKRLKLTKQQHNICKK